MEQTSAARTAVPERCVIVVAADLPVGRAANAAAVIALTVGQRHPNLVGPALIDASAFEHPGLTPIGITVLATATEDLSSIRDKGLQAGCDVIAFPVQGQRTTNYGELRHAVAQLATSDLRYVGVALVGPRDPIKRIIGNLSLLK